MFGKKMLPDAFKRAVMPGTAKTGPGQPPQQPMTPVWPPFNLAPRYPSLPKIVQPVPTATVNKFIVPIDMFDIGMRTVQTLFFPRPMGKNPAESSFAAAPMPGMIAPPLEVQSVAAGALNLQQQLGVMGIQATALQDEAENFG